MDKKAKSILFKTYWSSKGWKDERITAPDDFLYAKEKGLMFDPLTISHDDCVTQIIASVNSIPSEKVAKAFLSSLSTRRLDWRSGIICKNFKYGIIGDEKYTNSDLNVLNFERIKWGGVRHGDLLYTLFDLEQFKREQITEPTKADITIFKAILNAASSCKTGNFPSVLRDKLKDIPELKSNKDERSVIIEILACIGVLNPKSYNRPIAGKHDWTFVAYWRGEESVAKKMWADTAILAIQTEWKLKMTPEEIIADTKKGAERKLKLLQAEK